MLAYQVVQVIRTRLKGRGEHASWSGLRRILAGQRRVTLTLQCAAGRTLHVRKATEPEEELGALYAALGIERRPGGTCRVML